MLRFTDSAEHYNSVVDKWTARDQTHYDGVVSGSFGRHGSKSHFLWEERSLHKLFPDWQNTWIAGGAYYWNDYQAADAFNFQSGSTNAQWQVRLYFDPRTATLSVFRGGSNYDYVGVRLADYVIPNYRGSAWYYLEMKVTIHPSAGSAYVRVNGQQVIAITGVNTAALGTAGANCFCIGSPGGTPAWYIDDLYLCDATGSVNNDFLGDIRVDPIYPSGNGNSSQFAGSDGNSTDNYALVDETAQNGDTDYVESGTVGNKDTYAFGDLASASGTVFGLGLYPILKKTDAGSRSVCSIARLGGTEVDSADKVLGSSYAPYPDIRETKPGGGAWTITDINNAEFGIKVTA